MPYNKETDLFDGYIYCIENKSNGKKYIGQTRKTIAERFAEHKWDALNRVERKMLLHKAIVKYGIDQFAVKEVLKISTESASKLQELLDAAEIQCISEYDTLTPHGYNVSPGGYIVPPDRTVGVYCFTLDGTFVKYFESMSQASDFAGVNHSNISLAINPNHNDRKSAGGYLWSTTSVAPIYNPLHNKDKRKAIVQISKDGRIIQQYVSALEAAKCLNLQTTLISACCHGRRKSTGGYRWAFID